MNRVIIASNAMDVSLTTDSVVHTIDGLAPGELAIIGDQRTVINLSLIHI